ncbi:MAG: hypothetical protein ACLP4W_17020 [Mycobacterium sp.]|uniref:hypothetical protein n=1 Tax=Mycobacterium sp. TaxID=1785 RepID=UPI003F9691E2
MKYATPERISAIRQCDPLDADTQIGPQVSDWARGCGRVTRPAPTRVSGIGRENRLMMLDHSQKKNLLVSYSAKQLGLF